MCGRYVVTNPVTKTVKIVKKSINVEDNENYNAYPEQKLPVVRNYSNGCALENLQWGIFPNWAKNKNFKALINARLETIDTKPSFKNLIKASRCVVIADGFYEWQRSEKKKIPYYVYRKDNKVLYLAGIHKNNQFCLITEEASNYFKSIHIRQPVILKEDYIQPYLNLSNNGVTILKNRKKIDLDFYIVSKDVNKPSNNNKSLIQKI